MDLWIQGPVLFSKKGEIFKVGMDKAARIEMSLMVMISSLETA
jgi:hypothetical protein